MVPNQTPVAGPGRPHPPTPPRPGPRLRWSDRRIVRSKTAPLIRSLRNRRSHVLVITKNTNSSDCYNAVTAFAVSQEKRSFRAANRPCVGHHQKCESF